MRIYFTNEIHDGKCNINKQCRKVSKTYFLGRSFIIMSYDMPQDSLNQNNGIILRISYFKKWLHYQKCLRTPFHVSFSSKMVIHANCMIERGTFCTIKSLEYKESSGILNNMLCFEDNEDITSCLGLLSKNSHQRLL